MHSNDYKQYVNVLRGREVTPPFEDIRTLVLAQKRIRRFPVPFWLFISTIAPALLAVAILFYPELFGLQRITGNSSTEVKPEKIYQQGESSLQSAQMFVHGKIRKSKVIKAETSSAAPSQTNTIKNSEMSNSEIFGMQITHTEETENTKPAEPAALPIKLASEYTESQTSDRKFSFFLSGGFLPVQSSIAFTDRLAGSLGIRYCLNSSSSLALEFRKNAFVKQNTSYKTVYRDTILKVGNETFHNTIGVSTPFPSEAPNSFYSLGVGYHYSFIQEGRIIPFGAFFLNGSTTGGLTSEILGVEYVAHPLAFELGLRNDQLFSTGSSPQNSFSMNLGVSYYW